MALKMNDVRHNVSNTLDKVRNAVMNADSVEEVRQVSHMLIDWLSAHSHHLLNPTDYTAPRPLNVDHVKALVNRDKTEQIADQKATKN